MKKLLSLLLALILLSTSSTIAIAAESTLGSCTRDEVMITSEADVMDSEFKPEQSGENENSPILRDSGATLPTTPANALALSGNTPYHYGTYTLSAGSAGYVKLTATQNYYCSAFTTGSKDTYIEVYSDSACTNLVTSNDDSGHSLNAQVYFFIYSGNTYYIKVRGYSSTTSGSYTFVLHRGMPTSRSEKSDMFSTYNSTTYQYYTNCYTYALGYYVNPVTGRKFRVNGQNPGEMSGDEISITDLVDVETAKEAIETALDADCEYFGGDWREISATTQPRDGYYKVALVLSPGNDYHWYRQLPNGQWGHKPSIETARKTDFSNYIIYMPNSCDRDGTAYNIPNYTEFIGWYELKTPTNATASASMATIDEGDEPVYSINNNLTMDLITTLSVGTSYESAMEVLGAAHSYYGSGMIGNVYELVDGTQIIVYFRQGEIEQIRTMPMNGTYEIIVG